MFLAFLTSVLLPNFRGQALFEVLQFDTSLFFFDLLHVRFHYLLLDLVFLELGFLVHG